MKKTIVLVISIFLFSFADAQVDHWETAVYDTLEWHYLVPDANTPNSWIDPAFDDAAWSADIPIDSVSGMQTMEPLFQQEIYPSTTEFIST